MKKENRKIILIAITWFFGLTLVIFFCIRRIIPAIVLGIIVILFAAGIVGQILKSRGSEETKIVVIERKSEKFHIL